MSDKVISFPSCLWYGRQWWHAGKSYKHLGILKELCTPAEWKRIYDYDYRRYRRWELLRDRKGNAV